MIYCPIIQQWFSKQRWHRNTMRIAVRMFDLLTNRTEPETLLRAYRTIQYMVDIEWLGIARHQVHIHRMLLGEWWRWGDDSHHSFHWPRAIYDFDYMIGMMDSGGILESYEQPLHSTRTNIGNIIRMWLIKIWWIIQSTDNAIELCELLGIDPILGSTCAGEYLFAFPPLNSEEL